MVITKTHTHITDKHTRIVKGKREETVVCVCACVREEGGLFTYSSSALVTFNSLFSGGVTRMIKTTNENDPPHHQHLLLLLLFVGRPLLGHKDGISDPYAKYCPAFPDEARRHVHKHSPNAATLSPQINPNTHDHTKTKNRSLALVRRENEDRSCALPLPERITEYAELCARPPCF